MIFVGSGVFASDDAAVVPDPAQTVAETQAEEGEYHLARGFSWW